MFIYIKKAQPRFLSFRIKCIIFLNKCNPFKGKSILTDMDLEVGEGRYTMLHAQTGTHGRKLRPSNKFAAATQFQRWTKSSQFSAFFFPGSAVGNVSDMVMVVLSFSCHT